MKTYTTKPPRCRAAVSLRTAPLPFCRAWMLQGLRCVRCGCEFYAESAEPCGLVILACSDLSASTPSPKSLPPARPARANVVGLCRYSQFVQEPE